MEGFKQFLMTMDEAFVNAHLFELYVLWEAAYEHGWRTGATDARDWYYDKF